MVRSRTELLLEGREARFTPGQLPLSGAQTAQLHTHESQRLSGGTPRPIPGQGAPRPSPGPLGAEPRRSPHGARPPCGLPGSGRRVQPSLRSTGVREHAPSPKPHGAFPVAQDKCFFLFFFFSSFKTATRKMLAIHILGVAHTFSETPGPCWEAVLAAGARERLGGSAVTAHTHLPPRAPPGPGTLTPGPAMIRAGHTQRRSFQKRQRWPTVSRTTKVTLEPR